MTTSLWLEMHWKDSKLRWNASQYGGIRKLIVEAELLWLPDIILYDNSNGNPHVAILGNAVVHFDGTVVWKPPVIYKSYCSIDTEYFPYDIQNCRMKFGAWSTDGTLLDIVQADVSRPILYEDGSWVQYQDRGMDLTYYETSAEWDLLNLTNSRHELAYSGCCGERRYIDIRFEFKLRRKALFFTVFFVLPCIMIASLTTFAFYLPSCSMKKMTMLVQLFMSLIVFLIALADLLPPTSVKVPLIAQYILFTMTLISFSITVNVAILNVHHRSDTSHRMAPCLRNSFLRTAPRILNMKVPAWHEEDPAKVEIKIKIRSSLKMSAASIDADVGLRELSVASFAQTARRSGLNLSLIRRMIAHVHFIADHFSTKEDTAKGIEDWAYVALIIDRILLYFFTLVNIVGMTIILLQAPSLWDGIDPLQIPERVRPLGRDTYAHTGVHDHVNR